MLWESNLENFQFLLPFSKLENGTVTTYGWEEKKNQIIEQVLKTYTGLQMNLSTICTTSLNLELRNHEIQDSLLSSTAVSKKADSCQNWKRVPVKVKPVPAARMERTSRELT